MLLKFVHISPFWGFWLFDLPQGFPSGLKSRRQRRSIGDSLQRSRQRCGFDPWVGSIPGSGKSPGRGHGNPVPYSSLENPAERKALQATAHGVAEPDATEATEHPHTPSPSHTFSFLWLEIKTVGEATATGLVYQLNLLYVWERGWRISDKGPSLEPPLPTQDVKPVSCWRPKARCSF